MWSLLRTGAIVVFAKNAILLSMDKAKILQEAKTERMWRALDDRRSSERTHDI
jgi:hypothetical protein